MRQWWMGIIATLAMTMSSAVNAQPASGLQQLQCKFYDWTGQVTFIQSWLGRMERNALVFVDANGNKVAAPVQNVREKPPECSKTERVGVKDEKIG